MKPRTRRSCSASPATIPSRIEVVRLPLGTFLEQEKESREESKQACSISGCR